LRLLRLLRPPTRFERFDSPLTEMLPNCDSPSAIEEILPNPGSSLAIEEMLPIWDSPFNPMEEMLPNPGYSLLIDETSPNSANPNSAGSIIGPEISE
jgi:hypothetical protein